jgi:tetratricopeptide (TPR) repeat protein
LIDFIDGVSKSVRLIEPLTLQLVCHRAETIAIERRAAGVAAITLGVQDFGGMPGLERLVRDHYHQVLNGIKSPDTRARAQLMFEEGLLDPAGKRLMLEEGEIEREYRLDGATLEALVSSSLLRREPRNESVFYEISHDRLTDTIAKHRKPRMPRWVKPTLAVCMLFLLLATFSWWWQLNLTKEAERANEQAQSARNQAEYMQGQLLSEKHVSRLREAGMDDALRQILEQSSSHADDHESGIAAVLRWRHVGDVERTQGSITKARDAYEQALAALDALPSAAPNNAPPLLLAERARIVSAMGLLAADSRELTRAEKHFDEAMGHWETVLKGAPHPQERIDAADTHLGAAIVLTRLGDYDRAEALMLAAGRLAAKVLSSAYDGKHGSALDANFDTGRAMQVFADAALNLSQLEAGEEAGDSMAETAVALAREAVRLRPMSFQARKELGTAIISRLQLSQPTLPADWHELLDEARRQFDDLGRIDSSNLIMQRERAAVALAGADIIARCVQMPGCRKDIRTGELEKSKLAALESIGTFGSLAARDPENRSWRADVAWGMSVRAEQMAADRDSALTDTLDGAIKAYTEARIDQRDLDIALALASRFIERARLQTNAGQLLPAQESLKDAAVEIERVPASARYVRMSRLDEAIPLLRDAGLSDVVKRMQDARVRLQRPGEGAHEQSHKRAQELNREAVDLTTSPDSGNPAQMWTSKERLYARAVDEYPFDAVFWRNLQIARNEMVTESDDAAHEATLRGALAAAWMASALNPEDTQSLRTLYEARWQLALLLFEKDHAGPELLALTVRALEEANELARRQPKSAEPLVYLAYGHLGVGLARASLGIEGWDESFRVAMLFGNRSAEREPKRAELHIWLGTFGRIWATLLDQKQRAEDAAEQRRLALKACRMALTISAIKPEERIQAEECIKEIADAGVR